MTDMALEMEIADHKERLARMAAIKAELLAAKRAGEKHKVYRLRAVIESIVWAMRHDQPFSLPD